MEMRRGPKRLGCVVAALLGMVTAGAGQPEVAPAGRFSTQVATLGTEFWVYTLDTTSGAVWFLDRPPGGEWTWVGGADAPGGPGPVGKYELIAFANERGAHVYVSDTTTGRLWLLDEQASQWRDRGAPVQATADGNDAAPPLGRFRTQILQDGQVFWVYTADTTTGGVWFLDRLQDGVWQWVDEGASPAGSGPAGRYKLVGFANPDGSHIYVQDTSTGALWRIDEEGHRWLPRSAPEPSLSPDGR